MNLNRRGFLLGSAAAMTLAGCSTAKVGARERKPGEKMRAAMIGCGIQMRTALLGQFLNKKYAPDVEIVACCDCDKVRATDMAKRVNDSYKTTNCKAVFDFREILADDSIDLVCIATPDHWHAYIAVEAMKRGKDVYCEKPLTFSVEESRQVIEAQEKYGRVFQTGSMQRSWREFRTAVSIVRGGAIGDVMYIDAHFGKPNAKLGGPSHPLRFWDDPKNAAKEGAPNPDVDWKMWLGPAKYRPYSDQLAPRGVNNFYPMFWRFDDDIGSGYNGDWGAHQLDIAQWGLDADKSGPSKVICSTEPYSTDLYQGGRRQFGTKMIFDKPYGKVELCHRPSSVWGTVFYGTKGIVAVNRGKIAVWTGTGLVQPTDANRAAIANATLMPDKLVAASIGRDYGTDAMAKKDNALDSALNKLEKVFAAEIKKAGLYYSSNHVKNFIDCCRSREMTISPAQVGGRGAILCLLLNLSYQYDTGFDWNGEKMTFACGSCCKGISLKREGDCNGWKVEV